MSELSRILRSVDDGGVMFWCPGCDCAHKVRVGAGDGPRWGYNGDPEKPTFMPSILVTYNGDDARLADQHDNPAPPAVCHSFVTDGQIQFLGDCTHKLAGQTVPIPEWDT